MSRYDKCPRPACGYPHGICVGPDAPPIDDGPKRQPLEHLPPFRWPGIKVDRSFDRDPD